MSDTFKMHTLPVAVLVKLGVDKRRSPAVIDAGRLAGATDHEATTWT